MKKSYALKSMLLALFVGMGSMLGWAQDSNKLSVTTQMFLSELNGDLSLDRDTKAERQFSLIPVDESWQRRHHGKNDGRLYAAPDTIDGKAYIAAYLRLNDAASVSEVEALGVVIQEEFANGLYTSLIPVDKINDVAGVSNVKRINVSPLKKTFTKTAREKTNTDDVLTLSTDAISAGLKQKYDGTGVVLGIIDTGIDFNHIAFKDASGNSRIKQAYVYNGSSAKTYTGSTITSTLTDDNTGDHGTHTSTTAGGSSVKVSGTTVTVTDDHANATYGGMAPGADLYLAGIKNLSSTYLDNAVKNMCTYADGQGKPLVVSNSWGSQFGPHDGTGDEADVYNSLFGDSHPNRVALFAASNDGGKSKDGEGGGYHLTGSASSSSPLRSILRSASYTNTDAGYYYYGIMANAWCRSTSVSSMTCKIYVLDSSTGAVKTTVTVSPSTSGSSVSGLSSYYSGTLYAYKDYVTSNKTQVLFYTSGLTSKSTSTTTKNGATYYKSNYTLAVEFAPSSGTAVIDAWGGSYGYFTNHLTTSGYTWTAGTDDGCYSDEATISNAISIGAYVSANTWKDYNGTSHSMADEYTMGDIAYFSSWGTAAKNPAGVMIPWISAPGARLAAGVNHNHTASVDDYSYYDAYKEDLVVNSTTNPYAMMEGTSMATPTAAGIVALWMQASLDANAQHKNLTVNDVKTIMKETAITDSYTTTGANKDHFGNGKIDALAGIKYILGATSDPSISVDQNEVAFEECYATKQYTKTVTVSGSNLEGNITVSKSGSNVFSVDKTSITQSNGTASATLTITYAPTSAGTQTGTITLKSTNAETVTISLTGTAEAATPTIVADKESLEFTALLSKDATQTVQVSGRFLSGNVTATLTDPSGVFAVDKSSLEVTEDGVELTVTFNASEEGSYTGTLLLASAGAASVSIALSATAKDGGTASDNYLNIAKYQTIDEAGWNTTYVNTLYKYTRDEDNEVAWLTMPLYGAWSSVYYSPYAQKWIASSMGTSNSYAGVDWASNDVFPGSATYFTGTSGNGRARAIGYNNSTTTDIKAVSFFVANTTGVKASGLGRSGVSSSYPAALKVYECTVNADGSLTAATTEAKSATSTSTSTTTPFVISIDGLDASKVYKVEASIYRGYMYEIAFQTPIEVDKTSQLTVEPTELAFETPLGVEQVKQFTVKGKYLTSPVTIECDNEAFQLDAEEITAADANAGATISVSFNPEEMGEQTGTLTLSSEGAEPITVSLTATPLQPTLSAEPTSVAFNTIEAGQTTTATFTVMGTNLSSAVQASLTDDNGVFLLSEDDATLSLDEVAQGKTVTLTFAPSAAGTYTGSIELTSTYAGPVTITLSGTATAPVPTITASETSLAFSGSTDTDITKTFTVSGRALSEDIAVSLTDPKHVFAVSTQSVAATSEGTTVTVTFNSDEEGDFTGYITLSSEGAADVVVALTASAMNGGTASDNYLNIAKYQTIDEAGWNTSYVDNLYKYTEYEDEEVAWLTMPIYGAWVGTYYNSHPQKWISSNVTSTQNKYAGTTWSSSAELLGNTPYFTSATSRAMGYNSRMNSTQETVTFYVTNTTAVKMLGTGQSRASSSYPATLKVYECTVSDAGVPTASSTAVKSESNSATSGTFVLTATDLDASKVYKVEAATYRSYICEIGFQTPLKKKVVGDINRDGVVTIADVTALTNIILGKLTRESNGSEYDFDAADVNGDGQTTIADVTALVNIILGK
ncbi:MAG: S8 family serine peptidase [Bacteroidaceae bacterium]|nr:S8 family serine peptidase [Bacteroidaceae bacterium]